MRESSMAEVAATGVSDLRFGANCFRKRYERSATSGGKGVGRRVRGEPEAKAYGMKRERRSLLWEEAAAAAEEEEE